jgi:hypothetical protein
MNLQAYAAHRKAQGLRGQSHVAVLKAIESGRLSEPAVRKVNGRWHIDAPLADAQWAGNTESPTGSGREIPFALARQASTASGGPTLAEAKRARAVYQAERERLAVMREKGELVPAQAVRDRWFEHGRAIRDNLMSIPDRIASQLASTNDPRETYNLLRQEITVALRILSDG